MTDGRAEDRGDRPPVAGTVAGPVADTVAGPVADTVAGPVAGVANSGEVLDDLGAFLATLRDAVGGDDVAVDTEAIWRRVLQRLDGANAPEG